MQLLHCLMPAGWYCSVMLRSLWAEEESELRADFIYKDDPEIPLATGLRGGTQGTSR